MESLAAKSKGTAMKTDAPCRPSGVVWIRWQDAVGESARHSDDPAKIRLAVNTNIGWITHEDAERVVLDHGCSTTGEYDIFVIPVVNIIQRIPLIAKLAKKATAEVTQ